MARHMKHSGIEWLGDIPDDWNVSKIKYLFSIIGGNGFPEMLQGNTVGDYPFCKVSDINGAADYVDTASNWVTQSVVDDNRFNIIPTGSILMAKIGAALARNHRKINTIQCCIDNNTQALVPRRDDDIRYLLYLSKCIDMSWFDNNSTVPSVNNTKLLNFFVPVPPIDEQQRIANFLDDKCARIDSVISKTRATVAEYKKLKQSIITRAVTKGIRPNRPTKDSGIEWLGDIPDDWKIGRLKNLFILQRGYDLPSEKFVEGDFPIYGSGGLMGYHNQKTSTAPNVVIGRSGSTGKLHYIEKDFWAHNTGIFISDKKGNFCKYLYYLLNVVDMEELSTKTAVPTLDRKKIQEYKLPYTIDIEEQKEIAQYLDEKTAAIDSLVAKKNRLVAELERLKKSLIFEYVTGKKEVAQ